MGTPVLWGSEILANTATFMSQQWSKIVPLTNGGFLALWEDYSTSLLDIRGQFFDADGTKRGNEFVVNTEITGAQKNVSAIQLHDGRVVVAWADSSGFNSDTGFGIRGRIMNADGTWQPSDFHVNVTTSGDQTNPSIVALANGGFVVNYFSGGQIAARQFELDAAGQVSGKDEQLTGINVTDMHGNPVSLDLGNGREVVFYHDGNHAIRGRLLTDSGQAITGSPEFLVSSTADILDDYSATVLADGRVVVVWAEDNGEFEIKAQIFLGDGTRAGAPINVGKETIDAAYPTVTALRDGGFAVAYADRFTSSKTIELVTFNQSGTQTGNQVRVDTYRAPSDKLTSSIVELADGRLVVNWFEYSAESRPDDQDGVRVRIVDPRELGHTWSGKEFGEQYIGTTGADNAHGNGGNDTLSGYAGNDTLDGGTGADVLQGGDGFDFASFASASSGVALTLTGSSEGDVFSGIEGLIGSSHDDSLTGNGAAILRGQGGNDIYHVKAGDSVEEAASGGTDTVIASGSYTLRPDAAVEMLTLSGVSSKTSANLTGSDSANAITGHAGKNTLKGQDGNDTIKGGLGSDKLYGGAGKDSLYGGTGSSKDVFVFDTRPNSRTNVDKIYDFNVTNDSIWLDNAVFTKLGKGTVSKPGKVSADKFWIGTKAHDASDRIIYDKKHGTLYYDADGSGHRSAQVKIATLSKNLKMTEKDFFVV